MAAKKKTTESKKVTIDDSPNRISMFYRSTTKKVNVVERGTRKWTCPTCHASVTTYTALTAIPICSGGERRHREKPMEEKK